MHAYFSAKITCSHLGLAYTVTTVICDPSRDLHEKVAYDRGSLNTVPTE